MKNLVLLAVVAVALTGCGDSSAVGTDAPAGTSTTAPATAPAAAEVGAVDASALCDFLRGEISRLQPVGSPEGRLAQLTVRLYNWTEEQKIDATYDPDQLTEKTCPDVRADVLTLIGADSFANAF